MKTPRTKIAASIAANTVGGRLALGYAKEIAAYLLAEGRTRELDSLLRDISADWAAQGYVEALVRTVYPLSTESKKDIEQQVRALYPDAKKIFVTEILDATIVGGLEISVANQQLDLSVEAKLRKFKQLAKAGKEY